MKKLGILSFFIIANLTICQAQMIKDTVFIEFDSNIDIIKSEADIKYIWLKNLLYEEELCLYNEFLHKYEQDTLPPPPPIFTPSKPSKFYKFFLIDTSEDCYESLGIIPIRKNVKIFDRKELKNLTPYHKKIFIVRIENNRYTCLPVLFYQNVQE